MWFAGAVGGATAQQSLVRIDRQALALAHAPAKHLAEFGVGHQAKAAGQAVAGDLTLLPALAERDRLHRAV